MRTWVIQCKTDRMSFWSNQFGWVYQGYDTFSDGDKLTNTLPKDGEWRPWGTLTLSRRQLTGDGNG